MMNKFKVGDKVVRLVGGNSEKFLHMQGGKDYYTITQVSRGGYWLQVDGVCDKDDPLPWNWANFELYLEPEDEELPPAPTSVLYLKENGRRKLTAEINSDAVQIKISLGTRGVHQCLGYAMDPASALQLASDLRRMAMDIKRKEKANV